MMCCSAIASTLFIPETFNDDAGVPLLPSPAVAAEVEEEEEAVPPKEEDVNPDDCAPDDWRRTPRTVDNATPLLAATFSIGHAPCILACTVVLIVFQPDRL